jgi:Gpi18-like mannosyltransferase
MMVINGTSQSQIQASSSLNDLVAIEGEKSMQSQHQQNWSPKVKRLALAGGLVYIALPVCMLFLPIFTVCQMNEATCYRQTYAEQGGSFLGYALFLLMIGIGALVIIAVTRDELPHKSLLLWLAMGIGWIALVLSVWGLGISFLPGAVLLLLAALAARQSTQPTWVKT